MKLVSADLPSAFGSFKLVGFEDLDKEHIALVKGNARENVLVRVHSECLTGDALGSLRCDCREQLLSALKVIEKEGGILLYLRQEGRGIGLLNKIKAYKLQEQGHDTYEANRALGFEDDERDFSIAGKMLQQLGVSSIRLLTNNPNKIKSLEKQGIPVVDRVPLEAVPGDFNENYLRAKKRAGHLFSD